MVDDDLIAVSAGMIGEPETDLTIIEFFAGVVKHKVLE